MIRIPSVHRKRAEPLKRCIEVCSADFGFSEEQVVQIVTRFLEEISNEVTKGRMVAIPGFGMFGQTGKSTPRGVIYRPGFIPARPFRDQVSFGTRPTPDAKKQRKTYSQNNARGSDSGSRTFVVMQRLRSTITAQLTRK